mmetsp:Transcript_35757/g.77330  ORF Transcript_35757/g.77330 Transcript_35757/m.77330 type:complete len:104 (-) Transcript_35757:110-421(-)
MSAKGFGREFRVRQVMGLRIAAIVAGASFFVRFFFFGYLCVLYFVDRDHSFTEYAGGSHVGALILSELVPTWVFVCGLVKSATGRDSNSIEISLMQDPSTQIQ